MVPLCIAVFARKLCTRLSRPHNCSLASLAELCHRAYSGGVSTKDFSENLLLDLCVLQARIVLLNHFGADLHRECTVSLTRSLFSLIH